MGCSQLWNVRGCGLSIVGAWLWTIQGHGLSVVVGWNTDCSRTLPLPGHHRDIRRDVSAGIRQIFGGRQNLIQLRGNAYGNNSWHRLCARIRNPIVCRRSSRQCIARFIRLRSTLHPPPDAGSFAFRISCTRGFSRQFIYLELKAHFLIMNLTSNPHDIRLKMESAATFLSHKMVRKLQGCWSNLQATSSPS